MAIICSVTVQQRVSASCTRRSLTTRWLLSAAEPGEKPVHPPRVLGDLLRMHAPSPSLRFTPDRGPWSSLLDSPKSTPAPTCCVPPISWRSDGVWGNLTAWFSLLDSMCPMTRLVHIYFNPCGLLAHIPGRSAWGVPPPRVCRLTCPGT